MRDTPDVALHSSPDHLDFLVRGERIARYLPHAPVPGFAGIYIAGGRMLTAAAAGSEVSVWLSHGSVNGLGFGLVDGDDREPSGRIVSRELLARRGSHSVGFQQECAWIGPDGREWLRDLRTVRALPGPCSGSMLDFIVTFTAPEKRVVLDRSEAPFLRIQTASPMFPAGGGQFRNSIGGYDLKAVHGMSAAWCGCIGVVQGETAGLVCLDHPQNPFSPTPWLAQEDRVFSPSPFLRHRIELAPHTEVTFRYRLMTHRGYVDEGWATDRWKEFSREPLRS